MCKRDTADPLARLFLDRYHLHLLRQPREKVDVGLVYPSEGGVVSAPGHFKELLDAAPALPKIRRNEAMADVSGTASNQVEAKVGLSLLDSFLAALDLAGVAAKLKGDLHAGKTSTLRFSFQNPQRDSIDPFALESTLRRHTFEREQSLFRKDRRYYFVTAVVRSDSITFTALDEGSKAVELAVGVDELAKLDAEADVKKSANDEITVRGPKRLAFGVELQELIYDDARKILRLQGAKDIIKIRTASGHGPGIAPAWIGGAAGDIFLPEEA